MSRKRVLIAIGLMIFGLTQWDSFTDLPFWQRLDGFLVDCRYRLRERHSPGVPDDRVKLVGLCSTSLSLDTLAPEEIAASPALEKMKQPWPWDRSIYAAILEKLMRAGAKVVMFDFVFVNETAGDPEFAAMLDKYRDRVVIGQMFQWEKGSSAKASLLNHTLRIVRPNPRLIGEDPAKADKLVGLVNQIVEIDNVVRFARYRTSQSREYQENGGGDGGELEEASSRSFGKETVPDNIVHISARVIEKFQGRVHTPPPEKKVFINYLGPAGTYRAAPVENMFVDALWGKPPYESGLAFSNKIVVVGPMAESFHDIHVTPFGETPGPEIQTQMIAALLQGRWITEPTSREKFFITLGILGVTLLIALGITQAWVKFLLGTATGVVFFLGSQYVFEESQYMISMLPPLFCLAATGIFGTLFEFTLEQIERRRYRNVLDRYVSKNVAKAILEDRRSIEEAFKGRKQPVTILFSDIRGFTSMTETADAAELVAQLNEYFHKMVGTVLEKEGTLQKFIGDAIMAVWGDTHSIGLRADATLAVASALQMRAHLVSLNAGWLGNPKRSPLAIGIGVNHGHAIVGNIGHENRMEFTVLGDSVNLAARLESATKQFHCDILIGEQVEELTRDAFVYRTVDLLVVKGKSKPVKVFAPLTDRSVPPPAWLLHYETGIDHYRKKEFAAAIASFNLAREGIQGDDFLCQMYLSRCTIYQSTPPPPDWDGSFTLTDK